ncbi:MAG TPA: sortase [Candidatus Limnocylindrales bacterium]|nr:sortase [Candidatus Limnocylindrales bacterium]
MDLGYGLRTRLVPAVLFAAGLTFVAGGLLSFLTPVAAGEAVPSGPVAIISPAPPASPDLLTFPPLASPSPSASSGPAGSAVATRIVIPSMRIDLPIVRGPKTYPYCNVAMFHPEFHQPGQPGATFIYAHARVGMFLPLLDASRIANGKKLLGDLVQVYTADDRLHLYEITRVLRHQISLDRMSRATAEELWLQTSEGVKGTQEKLHVVATPFTVLSADHAEANPKARPVACG